jgi:uncharacterized protein (TIGR01777 family)
VSDTEIVWDPRRGTIEREKLEGADAVIHLAGENVGGGRWSAERRREILESRVLGTKLIAETVAGLRAPPRVLVSASAIGAYGHRGEEVCDEASELGSGFLADVCRDWEGATAPASHAGVRVVHARLGVVIDPKGGALSRMLPVFNLGLGGRIGSGEQWMSWVGLDDVVGAIHHLVMTESAEGPVNVVAPEPVRNSDLTAAVARVLRRPAIVPVPAAVVRLGFGEMGDALLLASTRAHPKRLMEAGFEFSTPMIESALRHELGVI